MTSKEGFSIQKNVFGIAEITAFRQEADRLADASGSACVRHIRDKSESFSRLAVSEKIIELIGPAVVPVRSILFDKRAGSNWPVPWHQDISIAVAAKEAVDGYGPWSVKGNIPHVQPPEALLAKMITVRIHLDETTIDNGALKVVPGSHLRGKLANDADWRVRDRDAVVCECSPGDVLLMAPLILHSSERAKIPGRRRVIHFEFAEPGMLDSKLSWHEQ